MEDKLMICQLKRVSVVLAVLILTLTATAQNSTYISGVVNKTEKENLSKLIKESYSILQSDLFRANMLSIEKDYPSIFLQIENDMVNGSVKTGSTIDILNILQSKKQYRYVPAAAGLVGDNKYFFALAGIIGDNINGSFTLGRGNLSNWLSNDMVEKSCPVNSVSHELSHLISSDKTNFRIDTQPIRDMYAASKSGTNAVASYLIGTVAQCTWLQKNNYSPKVDLMSCIKVFGHRGFNSGRCNQFSSNQKIEYRPDLYEEHKITDF
jgi:hypothetical protein